MQGSRVACVKVVRQSQSIVFGKVHCVFDPALDILTEQMHKLREVCSFIGEGKTG